MSHEQLHNGHIEHPVNIEEKTNSIFTIYRTILTKNLYNLRQSFIEPRIEIIEKWPSDPPAMTMDHYKKYNPQGEIIVQLNTAAIHGAFHQKFYGNYPQYKIDSEILNQRKDAFVKEYVGKSLARMYGKISIPYDGAIQFGATVIPPILWIARFNQISPELNAFGTPITGIIFNKFYKEIEERWLDRFMNRNWEPIGTAISYNPEIKWDCNYKKY